MANVKYKPVDFKAKMKDGAVKFSGIDKIDVNNDNSGDYHLITFVLDDKTNLGLKFRPMTTVLADSPFWIQPVANGCPSNPAGAAMPKVVEPLFISPDAKELTVINYNAKIEEMYFALRMVDSAGNGHDYDPIMNNQNGGGGGISLAEAATIGIGLASFAAILYTSMYGVSL